MARRMPYLSKCGVSSSIDRYHCCSERLARLRSPENSETMSRTSRASASSSRRRQLRTWAIRSASSGEDQLNTGLRVRTSTPLSFSAFLRSSMKARSALG